MADKRIADLFNIKNRFLRSVHLERDFLDSTALSGYVPTNFVQQSLGRICEGLRPRSGQRAWRITGDYGSGKSSFALLLAHAFAGQIKDLSPELRKAVDVGKRVEFLPVLVTCSRQPLRASILKALQQSIQDLYGKNLRPKAVQHIQRLLAMAHGASEEDIVDAILDANSRIIADGKSQGLLLIIDELGKFLEFAAGHPEHQDVFLLQRLAESASRSGETPVFVVCLLHQGFNAYADQLNQSAQREWEKVAGRFDEIVFDQPVEQIGHLIASALDVSVDRIPRQQVPSLRHAMRKAAELGWFGAAHRQTLNELAARLYPLHPMVLPVLIRVFRRFGQNERSLFSFLLSNEPFGLQAFSEQSWTGTDAYQLHNLFDYVRTNLGHRLTVHSYRSHWNLIESVIESYTTDEPLHIQILKTVGILNLLNDDLLPTEETLLCALSGDDQARQRQVKAALEKLRKRVLYDRGRSAGLCLWPHTSVDLEKAYEDARRAVQTPRRVASLVTKHLEIRPVVARRHYIETGNLRHFDVRYCPVPDLPGLLEQDSTEADGVVVVPLCENGEERERALKFAHSDELKTRRNWIVAVPEPLSTLAGLLQEVQRWEWIITSTKELNGDKFGREEASRQLRVAKDQLERRLQSYVGFKQFGERTSLKWFHQGKPLEIADGRHLLSQLSRICDDTYSEAPRINNELVNRRSLSSAAAAARMRLIERMFKHGTSALLGMDTGKKPPEMSMYLSVLRNTGIHQECDGKWRIGEPHQRQDRQCRVLPTLTSIRNIVQSQPDARVKVSTLFEELRKPPLGVRDGLIPLLLTVFAIAHEHDVAFYKDGTFLREMTSESMLVLTKQPDRFEIQYCKIEGVRAELFEKLLSVLEVKPSGERRTELLDVVKPLCVFVAQIPVYVHNTKKLSATAIAVRDAILAARDPSRLLFNDLPKACGFDPFPANATGNKEVQLFIRGLKAALDELRAAFPEMQERLRKLMREAFDIPGTFQQFRTALSRRAEQVVLGVSEPKLRAFCLRLMDDNLPESDWLESVGSFLALKPPAKWHDAEEDLFIQELGSLAARFHNVESILFADGKPSSDRTGIRLAITQANGTEYQQVIHFTADEESTVTNLRSQFESLLNKNKRIGLAAVSLAISSRLAKMEK
jgi:hypothetical protein